MHRWLSQRRPAGLVGMVPGDRVVAKAAARTQVACLLKALVPRLGAELQLRAGSGVRRRRWLGLVDRVIDVLMIDILGDELC